MSSIGQAFTCGIWTVREGQDDWETVDQWRSSDAFRATMGSCRELCEDFRANDSTLRVAIPSSE